MAPNGAPKGCPGGPLNVFQTDHDRKWSLQRLRGLIFGPGKLRGAIFGGLKDAFWHQKAAGCF